jgi:hypothetical protein
VVMCVTAMGFNDLFRSLTAPPAETAQTLTVLPVCPSAAPASSIIQTAVDERYCSIYYECTVTAKELAHTGGGREGATLLVGAPKCARCSIARHVLKCWRVVNSASGEHSCFTWMPALLVC